jgi:hypothetical protein
MGYNAPDPNALLNVINQITDPAPNSDYGTELTFTFNERPNNVYRTAYKLLLTLLSHKPQHIPALIN